MGDFFMANAAKKVKSLLQSNPVGLTLSEIKNQIPDLKANEISMALCYLMRMRWLTRQPVKNTKTMGRKNVYTYTYHSERLTKTTESINDQQNA